jgi:hypothetical protein
MSNLFNFSSLSAGRASTASTVAPNKRQQNAMAVADEPGHAAAISKRSTCLPWRKLGVECADYDDIKGQDQEIEPVTPTCQALPAATWLGQ